jgi:hypothetical protein
MEKHIEKHRKLISPLHQTSSAQSNQEDEIGRGK